MLTDLKIKNEVAIGSVYTKGCHYYWDGRVKNLRYDPDSNSYEATVLGGQRYSVWIELDEENEVDSYECDCPAFYNYGGACKHVVAVMKAIQAEYGQHSGRDTALKLNHSTKALLDFFGNPPAAPEGEGKQVTARLRPTYCFSITGGHKRNWLEFAIGNERMYVMKDIKKFLEAVISGNEIVYGKNYAFNPREAVFDRGSKAMLALMRTAYTDERQLSSWDYYSTHSSAFNQERIFKLNNTNLLKFLDIMGEDCFEASINGDRRPGVKIINGRPPFKLDVRNGIGGLKASLDLEGDVYYGLDADFRYFYHRGLIYRTDPVFSSYIQPLMKCFNDNRKPEIAIPAAEASGFFSAVVPALEKVAQVKIDASLSKRFYREPLERQVYFDRFGDGICARLVFKYGEKEINPADATDEAATAEADGKMLIRSVTDENRIIGFFKRYGFEASGDRYVQPDEEDAYGFLLEGLPALAELAEIFYSEDFKGIRIKSTGKVSAGVRLNIGTGMLEMAFRFEDMAPQEMIELLSSYRLKKRYHRLKNGAFIPLDTPDFKNTAELVERLDISDEEIAKKVVELPKYRAIYIDSLVRETVDFHIERSGAFKKMVQDIREPEDLEYEVPEGISGRLRDYQKTGFKWLKSLAGYGFGGILADDMGLGKTLQVITFILSEKSGEDMPSLVVAPTSLLYNWQEEVRKFAPELKVTVISGQQEDRLEQLKEAGTSDIVVTSYALMKRDIQLYDDMTFKYCFIDEAQHIKNPNTLNAKSVKSIRAKGYFALTGTPIENTLTELWSIFDFLMPGYLLTHTKFTARYETPIVKNEDRKVLKDLGLHIKPFILRRMKKDVLKELPEKIESKMSNEMTLEQARVYAAYMMQAKKEFEDEILSNGFEKSRIKILALLTRLRQVCCHPALFIENYAGGSGKLDMLMEILEDAVSGGHRILLFSQFTGMLSLIGRELEDKKMAYHYLDGATKAEERIRLVHSFNSGEKDVFLISLKAGGTGLNLTGADMVIHYDPWWNPAVEDQATDRAYRIGQKNAVQVFKLITRDTIEEKIYALQQKKKELIDAVIKPGESFLSKMSEEEIRKLFEV